MSSSSSTIKGFLAALGMAVCWTGFNIVSRLAGKSTLTPYDVMAIRFGVAGLVALPFLLLRDTALDPSRLLALTAFGGLGYTFFVYTGLFLAPAADAGIVVNGGMPLITALISCLALGYRPRSRALLALALTAFGLVLMGANSVFGASGESSQRWLGDLCFLAAATCWASYGILLRQWHVRPLDATFGVVTTSMIVYLPIYLLFLPKTLPHVAPAFFALQCVYQGLVAGLLASVLFATANLNIGPIKTSLVLTLVPALSAVAAIELLGEPLQTTAMWGMVAVSIGAVLGTWQPDQKVA